MEPSFSIPSRSLCNILYSAVLNPAVANYRVVDRRGHAEVRRNNGQSRGHCLGRDDDFRPESRGCVPTDSTWVVRLPGRPNEFGQGRMSWLFTDGMESVG